MIVTKPDGGAFTIEAEPFDPIQHKGPHDLIVALTYRDTAHQLEFWWDCHTDYMTITRGQRGRLSLVANTFGVIPSPRHGGRDEADDTNDVFKFAVLVQKALDTIEEV